MRKATFWLSLALVFVIPLENAIVIPGLGRLSRAIGLLVAAFWVATIIITGKARKPRPIHAVIVLFVLWNAASVLWSLDLDRTTDRILTYFQLFGMVMVIWDLYATPTALHAGLQAYVLGAYVSLGGAIYNFVHAQEFYYQRYTGMKMHVNDLALILVLGLPVAWYLALHQGEHGRRSYWLTVINYLYVPLAILVVLLTASRGAVVAALPALLYIFLSLHRLKLHIRFLLFVLLAGSLFVLLPFVPESSFQRLAATEVVVLEGDLNGRLEIWREGFITFTMHPWIGVGSGVFRTAATETGKLAHNFVISLLVELGIIGFLLYAAILAMAVYHALDQPARSRQLWLAMLMVWIIGATTHNWEYRKQTWLFLSFVTVSASVYARREESGLLMKLPDRPRAWADRRRLAANQAAQTVGEAPIRRA
ncbi:MAG: O-antigen ligase family protein [bacterium]